MPVIPLTGDPQKPATEFGPMISPRDFKRPANSHYLAIVAICGVAIAVILWYQAGHKKAAPALNKPSAAKTTAAPVAPGQKSSAVVAQNTTPAPVVAAKADPKAPAPVVKPVAVQKPAVLPAAATVKSTNNGVVATTASTKSSQAQAAKPAAKQVVQVAAIPAKTATQAKVAPATIAQSAQKKAAPVAQPAALSIAQRPAAAIPASAHTHRVSYTPKTATKTTDIKPVAPAAPDGPLFVAVQGDETVSFYDPSSDRIDTYEGPHYALTSAASIQWSAYPFHVHFRCTASGACTLEHRGVSADAKLIR